MSRSLGALTLDLIANIGGFVQGMDKAARVAQQESRAIQKTVRGVERQFRSLTRTLQSMAGVIGVALSASALNGWVKGTLEAAANTDILAKRLGVGVEELTTFRYVSEQAGVSADTFDASLTRLTRRLGAAANGGGPAAASLKRLGLNAQELLKLPLDQRILAISDSMKKLDTQAEKLTAAQDLMGDSGRQLVSMFDMSREEVAKLADEGKRLGYVFSEEFAESANYALSELDKIRGAFGNLATSIAAEFLPDLNAALENITVEDIEAALEAVRTSLGYVGEAAQVFAVIVGTRMVGSLAASTAAFAANTVAQTYNAAAAARVDGASRAAAIGIGIKTTALRGMSVALGVLGGPVGLLSLVAGGMYLFYSKTKEARPEVDALARSLDGLDAELEKLTEAQANAKILENLEAIETVYENLHAQQEEYAGIQEELEEKQKRYNELISEGTKLSIAWAERTRERIRLLENMGATLKAEIDTSIQQVDRFSEAINKLQNQAHAASQALDEVASKDYSGNIEQFEKMAAQYKERIALIGKTGSAEQLRARFELGQYSDLNQAQKDQLLALAAEEDARNKAHRSSQQRATSSTRSAGVKRDVMADYRRVMESVQTEEERFNSHLEKNIQILKEASATQEDFTKVRMAAYESASMTMPGADYGADDSVVGNFARLQEQAEELERWREHQLEKLEAAFGREVEITQAAIEEKERIEAAYRERRAQYDAQMKQESLLLTQTMTGDTLRMLEEAGLKSSGIYKAMFLANKAAAFGNAIISAHEASAKALATIPAPMNVPMAATIKAVGLANAGVIAGTALTGMAHDGIESVPKTGTWLLEKGERVMTNKTSANLDKTLEMIRQNNITNNNTPTIVVNVTVNADGSTKEESNDTGNDLAKIVKGVVVQTLQNEFRPGGIFSGKKRF